MTPRIGPVRLNLAFASWVGLAVGFGLMFIFGQALAGDLVITASLVGFLVHRSLLRVRLRELRRAKQIETFD